MAVSFVDLLTILVFVVLVLGFSLIALRAVTLGRDPVRRRLVGSIRDAEMEEETNGAGFSEGLAAQLPLTNSDNGLLELELLQAGYLKPTARRDFLALRNGCVIVTVMCAALAIVAVGPSQQETVLLVIAVGLAMSGLSWGIPRLVLRWLARRRSRRIQAALPDALDMISMSLTGGLSLADSLGHVGREMAVAHPELALEMLLVRRQAEFATLEQAFRQLARRVDAPEVQSLAALVSQSQRLGSDIVSSIRDFVDSMRLKRRQRADEIAQKASVKMLFPLTLLLLPAAFIILWGPAALKLWKFLQDFEGP